MIAADTDAEAERIAASADLHDRPPRQRRILPLASPEEAAAYPYTPVDRERIARHRTRLVVGGVDRVKERLLALIEATRADELMITTMVFDHARAAHSYDLLARGLCVDAAVVTRGGRSLDINRMIMRQSGSRGVP